MVGGIRLERCADKGWNTRAGSSEYAVRDTDALATWVTDTSASLLASFGKGIVADLAAVRAALTEPWSNGQTEGQITKLKLVKRQMYGRARLDLLRARLIVPA